ncbi:toll/interleukin-1 receptor domain-containing protein [Lentzea sp. BCCO 10_0856]|uniref:Toll/interleukin-1 receptor domain-containing protein n=1 Tax=Lentzea miocenica TaxID=3095431 RepID=A0ABU4SYG9_9PSEU|nr:toll/interleukin-1 receptor domain-containing protein [Lentzea sp. BCCO 10_0856]MDX8030962.1 toll/interleukin-1 receptor domain-containing protein [Lentzea sp. BCCO 10_0856]
MTPFSDAPPIRCFLSYARQDDIVMDFVTPFASSLRHYAYADRGRALEIFLDRESIGWGDLVQPTLRAAVRGTTVFLPVLTRRYFDRPYCREELFLFYNQAFVDGVRGLLLPVVLLGAGHLTADNPDLAVQLVVERQHRSVQDAWLEGPSSPLWRRTMLSLAGELVDRVEAAERALLVDAPAIEVDVALELDRFSRDVQAVIRSTSDVVAEFQSLLGIDWPALAPAAGRLRDAGRSFERRAFETDRLLRAAGESFQAAFVSELAELVPGVEALLTSTHRLEASDVPIRRMMMVFREGLTALRSGLRVVESWAELPNPGQ